MKIKSSDMQRFERFLQTLESPCHCSERIEKGFHLPFTCLDALQMQMRMRGFCTWTEKTYGDSIKDVMKRVKGKCRHPLNSDVYVKMSATARGLVTCIAKSMQEPDSIFASNVSRKIDALDKLIEKFKRVYEHFGEYQTSADHYLIFYVREFIPLCRWKTDIDDMVHDMRDMHDTRGIDYYYEWYDYCLDHSDECDLYIVNNNIKWMTGDFSISS